MKCPKCGFENRPDARFCKECGQPMQAQAVAPAPPTPPTTVCASCGATAKPGARFCPRCGKPLAAEPTPPTPTPPPSAAQMPTQPSMPPLPQQYAPAPSPPPPAQPPAYAQPPAQPPPPAAPFTAGRRFPGWLWGVAGLAAVICIAVTIVAAVLIAQQYIGGEEEPTTPAPTETPTSEATPSPVPPTETPTVAPTSTAPTETPPTPTFDAQIGITASATELQVGDMLTVTVTVTNTGEVEFGNLRYQLLGELEPYLRATAGVVMSHEPNVPPGQSHTAIFVLEAQETGMANIRANVTMEVRITPPSTDFLLSEPLEVSISSP